MRKIDNYCALCSDDDDVCIVTNQHHAHMPAYVAVRGKFVLIFPIMFHRSFAMSATDCKVKNALSSILIPSPFVPLTKILLASGFSFLTPAREKLSVVSFFPSRQLHDVVEQSFRVECNLPKCSQ